MTQQEGRVLARVDRYTTHYTAVGRTVLLSLFSTKVACSAFCLQAPTE